MDKQFLADFEHPSFEQWLEKIKTDLKAKSLDEISHDTFEHFEIKAVYSEENSRLTLDENTLKNQSKTNNNDWIINHNIHGEQENKAANKEALKALMSGANAITFNESSSFSKLLEAVELPYIDVFFRPKHPSEFDLNRFSDYLNHRGYNAQQITGAVELNPYGKALQTGQFHQADINRALESALAIKSTLPSMRSLLVNGSIFRDAGSSITQELGYALAEGHELLVQLLEKGVSIDHASALFQFELSSGTQYLLETAKIKVFRALWSRIIEEYQPEHTCSTNTFIHSQTSGFVHTTVDVHSNLLRDTTASMAAAIGGADMITVTAFDSAIQDQKPSFANRLATNIQLMLKEESGLHKVIDATAGSYLFNDITNQLAKRAWTIFQGVEKEGGFTASIQAGTIQNSISEHYEKLSRALEEEKLVMVGVNKFINSEIKPLAPQKTPPIDSGNIQALQPLRLSANLEASKAQ